MNNVPYLLKFGVIICGLKYGFHSTWIGDTHSVKNNSDPKSNFSLHPKFRISIEGNSRCRLSLSYLRVGECGPGEGPLGVGIGDERRGPLEARRPRRRLAGAIDVAADAFADLRQRALDPVQGGRVSCRLLHWGELGSPSRTRLLLALLAHSLARPTGDQWPWGSAAAAAALQWRSAAAAVVHRRAADAWDHSLLPIRTCTFRKKRRKRRSTRVVLKVLGFTTFCYA